MNTDNETTVASDGVLTWSDVGRVRKTIAIAFLVALCVSFLGLFPTVNDFYERHAGFQHFLHFVDAVLGLLLAFFELRHSGEANELHAAQNQLSAEANQSRNEANQYRVQANQLAEDNNKLQRESVEFQRQIQELQQKLADVRIYVRVKWKGRELQLSVENLSKYV